MGDYSGFKSPLISDKDRGCDLVQKAEMWPIRRVVLAIGGQWKRSTNPGGTLQTIQRERGRWVRWWTRDERLMTGAVSLLSHSSSAVHFTGDGYLTHTHTHHLLWLLTLIVSTLSPECVLQSPTHTRGNGFWKPVMVTCVVILMPT